MKHDRRPWTRRPIGRAATVLIGLWIVVVPAWLFADALATYRLHSDDFEYLAASRTFGKAIGNLYRAHNTHIVPTWRLLTWGVMRLSGTLENLQPTLASVAFGALVALMLLTGRLVARETRRAWAGLLAMVAVGTTSVMKSSATWYSSGQTIWAALGIVAMLHYLQGWRARGGWWRLPMAAIAAAAAGGFWTIGHAAGPAGAAYLLADGRRRCRWASAVPLAATLAAVSVGLLIGGEDINGKISFHGRSEKEAVNFTTGATHTLQAIPEDLVSENLGLEAETTIVQGLTLSLLLLGLWGLSLRRWPGGPSPLEAAGLVLIGLAYFVEWSFRGYLPFSSLRGVVPWYDTIPHVGLVLLGAGWIGRALGPSPEGRGVAPARRGQVLGVVVLQLALVVAHQPRVDALFDRMIPPESLERVEPILRTPELRLAAARALAEELATRQRLDLARLDRAEAMAQRLGIGHDGIAKAFGRVDVLEIPEVYDANGLLDIPDDGPLDDVAKVKLALGGMLRPSTLPVLGLDASGDFAFIR